MKLYREISHFHVKNPVITVGSFDGVHNGHRTIIARLKEIARDKEGETVVFTFSPHPRVVLFPQEENLRLLTTLDEKIALLEQAGVEHLIIYPFTVSFSKLSYCDFVSTILVGQLHMNTLVVGYDHRFGSNREGTFDSLAILSARLGFSVEKLDVLLMDQINISSTKIRDVIQEGDMEAARRYLGYWFRIHGTVIEGRQLGRKIQFPTANIETSEKSKIIPGNGVYAVYVMIDDTKHKGMLNIGTRPTVDYNADHRIIEVHILNFEGNLYQKQIGIEFITKIREERKFDSIELLKAQLEKDRQVVLEVLGKYR